MVWSGSKETKKRSILKPCKEGERRCASCVQPFPIETFAWSKRSGFRCTICPGCQERAFGAGLKFRYGISSDTLMQLFIEQDGCCATCGKRFTVDDPPQVDHDHKNDKVRGLLCRACNTALGLVHDSIDLMQKMMLYVIKHSIVRQ